MRVLVDHTTTNGLSTESPVWSPDGQWLAFYRQNRGHYDVYKVNATGDPEVTLLAAGFAITTTEIGTLWSPDSKNLAIRGRFQRQPNDSLYLVDADGQNLRQVAPVATGAIWWSRDGKHLAYVVSGPNEIAILEMLASSPPVTTVFGVSARPVYAAPDLSYFIFTDAPRLCSSPQQFNLFRAEANGSLSTLTPMALNGSCVSISTSGKHAAFAAAHADTTTKDLYVVNIDGSNQHLLLTDSFPGYDFGWSQDDSRLAFNTSRGLAVANIDGSAFKLLTHDEIDYEPTWHEP